MLCARHWLTGVLTLRVKTDGQYYPLYWPGHLTAQQEKTRSSRFIHHFIIIDNRRTRVTIEGRVWLYRPRFFSSQSSWYWWQFFVCSDVHVVDVEDVLVQVVLDVQQVELPERINRISLDVWQSEALPAKACLTNTVTSMFLGQNCWMRWEILLIQKFRYHMVASLINQTSPDWPLVWVTGSYYNYIFFLNWPAQESWHATFTGWINLHQHAWQEDYAGYPRIFSELFGCNCNFRFCNHYVSVCALFSGLDSESCISTYISWLHVWPGLCHNSRTELRL